MSEHDLDAMLAYGGVPGNLAFPQTQSEMALSQQAYNDYLRQIAGLSAQMVQPLSPGYTAQPRYVALPSRWAGVWRTLAKLGKWFGNLFHFYCRGGEHWMLFRHTVRIHDTRLSRYSSDGVKRHCTACWVKKQLAGDK